MSIAATELSVLHYRSFDDRKIELDPGITVLAGRNAVGKTNLVEALQLLTAGASFRKPTASELLREGEGSGRIRLMLEGEGRLIEMGLDFSEGKRLFTRNGKKARAAGIRGVLPSVLFCPDHLDMVKRSASRRREALDSFGVQLNENYAKLLAAYERTVEQRNNLLRDGYAPGLLEVWDESLATTGAQLLLHRTALLERIREHFIEVYRAIAPHEEPDVRYVPSFGALADGREAIAGQFLDALAQRREDELRRGCRAIAPHEEPDVRYVPSFGALADGREAIAGQFLDALAQRREDELRRGCTLVGPHRDEVLFTIDGRSARDFGSQGQQRSIVLAWKIAEVQELRRGCTLVGPHRDEVLFTIDGRSARDFGSQGQQRSIVLAWKIAEVQVTRDILGRYPLLLLDDVMSELDAARRDAIVGFIADEIQTVITTTNLGYFADDMLDRARVIRIGDV